MTHTERIHAATNEMNAALADAFEAGAKVTWEIGEEYGPVVVVVSWPDTNEFCECERNDDSFAGLTCDDCRKEIPAMGR